MNAVASSGGDPKSISEQMRLLKERASQPIEERMSATTLNAPGLSRCVCAFVCVCVCVCPVPLITLSRPQRAREIGRGGGEREGREKDLIRIGDLG
jgi:hypothetical protein